MQRNRWEIKKYYNICTKSLSLLNCNKLIAIIKYYVVAIADFEKKTP